MAQTISRLHILGQMPPEFEEILTEEALRFIGDLHAAFNRQRLLLLAQRSLVQADLQKGRNPTFPEETAHIRAANWKVCDAPDDLIERRVEITGPVERKMMINALNSGANVFMADFEDSLSPTWRNIVEGQMNLKEAVRRTLTFFSSDGKRYALKDKTATLVVRPRGWHLNEDHVLVDREPISASLFDFGLYFFHNAKELIERGTGPYFYLPKMENYLEARLWNNVFHFAQERLGIPSGTIRATVLLETILAAFQMDEILYELKEHISGLNAGRWDYIFSVIKKFSHRPDFLLPDRAQVTMSVPFMQRYCELLVHTCHKRGAHAMGGMSAFIPSRRDEEVNRIATQKVIEDKEREVNQGFDGTWVAHPDLVPIARGVFDSFLGSRPHQKDELKSETKIRDEQLIDVRIKHAAITESGIRNNISVAVQYVESWLHGIGAVAINNLMEDAATAEICRAQIWQWIRNEAKLDDGRTITPELYRQLKEEEMSTLKRRDGSYFKEAEEILDRLILSEDFRDFLTIEAYPMLNQMHGDA